jgi:hypothetical protein
MLKRPCNFHQVQTEWPKLVNAATEGTGNGDGPLLSATTTAAWHSGGYVLTNLGSVTLPAHPAKDWNIPSGWPIKVKKIPGGFRIVDDLLDDKVGTVKLWASNATVPTGWAKMDGTANASGNGGSGYNLTDKFVKGNGTLAATGGSTSYTPAGSITISSVSGTVSVTVADKTYTGTNTVSVALNLSTLESDPLDIVDHAQHYHETGISNINVEAGSGANPADPGGGLLASGGSIDSTAVNARAHLDSLGATPKATFIGASSYTTNADFSLSGWNHGHTATGSFSFSSGSGSFSGTPATIEPPFFRMFYIERLNNSSG